MSLCIIFYRIWQCGFDDLNKTKNIFLIFFAIEFSIVYIGNWMIFTQFPWFPIFLITIYIIFLGIYGPFNKIWYLYFPIGCFFNIMGLCLAINVTVGWACFGSSILTVILAIISFFHWKIFDKELDLLCCEIKINWPFYAFYCSFISTVIIIILFIFIY